MLCAQALAAVSQAMRTTASGAVLEVRCNAHDVADDLLAWARAAKHAVVDDCSTDESRRIRLRKA
jgi:TusA-related sulfurtransferase